MGSPVSAVVANLFIEHLKQIALNSALHRPRLWKWYVDGTRCIVENGKVDELLLHPVGPQSNSLWRLNRMAPSKL